MLRAIMAAAKWAALIALVLCIGISIVGELDRLAFIRDQLWLLQTVRYFSVNTHLQGFPHGVIDSRNLVYFCTATIFLLYIAVKGIELKR